ncbi:MAG: hypothetical protein R3C62_15720 [Chloroflexota bacterium]
MGKNGITPEMVLRLAKTPRQTPESWLARQSNDDFLARVSPF